MDTEYRSRVRASSASVPSAAGGRLRPDWRSEWHRRHTSRSSVMLLDVLTQPCRRRRHPDHGLVIAADIRMMRLGERAEAAGRERPREIEIDMGGQRRWSQAGAATIDLRLNGRAQARSEIDPGEPIEIAVRQILDRYATKAAEGHQHGGRRRDIFEVCIGTSRLPSAGRGGPALT